MNVYSQPIKTNVHVSVKDSNEEQRKTLSDLVKAYAQAGSIDYSHHMGIARFSCAIPSNDGRVSFNDELAQKKLKGEIGTLLDVKFG